MTTIVSQASISGREAGMSVSELSPNGMLDEYLLKQEPIFKNLVDLREKGWANPRGDDYFQRQRHRADHADKKGAWKFYHMMKLIGDEMQDTTRALSQPYNCLDDMNILDLCMAPGGYTASALKYNPGARAFGVTLPPEQGGHELLLPASSSSVVFLDITMLATEFGVEIPPSTHPECTGFLSDRPHLGRTFQLVFCDGQVLRTHQRAEYRQHEEGRRLAVSQLILALQRIRAGGTLIMLLHKIEAWDSTEILYHFSKFSSVQVFKPRRTHAIRSSFYLIARNVQPDSAAAKLAVEMWKHAWWHTTFGGENGTGARESVEEDSVRTVLDQFGEQLIKLGKPIWETQAKALSEMSFVR